MKTKLLLAGIAFAANALAQVPTNVPSSGLVGYWSLAGNGNDETGNSTCATYAATGTTDRYGNSGAASAFNGSSDYVEINDNSLLSGMSDLSISLWAKTSAFSGIQALVSKCWQALNCGSNSDTYVISLDGSDVQFATNNNSLFGLSSPPNLNASDLGVWRHIVVVFDHSASTASIYIDGWLLHSETLTGAGICSSTNSVFFGADADGYHYSPALIWRYFSGGLDDIGLWSRPLTDCEVLGLYAPEARAYQARPAVTTGLISNSASEKVHVGQNEPNPFNTETTVDYQLPAQVKNAMLVVYDITGAQLMSVPLKKEDQSVKISSEKLAAGVYMYSIVADGRKVADAKRMVVTGK